jgi:hypothetical protein
MKIPDTLNLPMLHALSLGLDDVINYESFYMLDYNITLELNQQMQTQEFWDLQIEIQREYNNSRLMFLD